MRGSWRGARVLVERAAAVVAAGLAAVLAQLALSGCMALQPAPAPAVADTPAPLAESDRRFVLDAAAAGHYQIEAARLAELRAGAAPVKGYAALVGQQQAVAVEELRLLARGRNVAWIGGVAAERRGVLDALAALTGAAFDRRYVEQVGIADLQADLAMVEAATRHVGDPALRAHAERLLPLLQNHLATAQALSLPTVARRRARDSA